jgi:hypothetical protein
MNFLKSSASCQCVFAVASEDASDKYIHISKSTISLFHLNCRTSEQIALCGAPCEVTIFSQRHLQGYRGTIPIINPEHCPALLPQNALQQIATAHCDRKYYERTQICLQASTLRTMQLHALGTSWNFGPI